MGSPLRPSWGRTFFYYSLIIMFGCITVLLLARIRGAGAVPAEGTYQSLDVFVDVIERVRNGYVKEVDTNQLFDGAIQGLFDNCKTDEDNGYLTNETYENLYVGKTLADVGVVLEKFDCQPHISQVIPGSPAAAEDVMPGDLLIKIEKKEAAGRSLYELLAMLRGEPDSEVKITTYRPGWTDIKEITLKRALVTPPALGETKVVGEKIGYLQVISLSDDASEKIGQAIKSLSAPANELKGLILDLRNTPAGNIEQTAKVADLFLDQGQISKIRKYKNQPEKVWNASAQSSDIKLPLVVLINPATKQEAEVLAAALGYHKRAVLLGTKTHGNASIEENINNGHDGVMRISVTLYEAPDGTTFQGKGIAPNEEIKEPREPDKEKEDPVLERAIKILGDPSAYQSLLAKK